jgi:hypothetical protein
VNHRFYSSADLLPDTVAEMDQRRKNWGSQLKRERVADLIKGADWSEENDGGSYQE